MIIIMGRNHQVEWTCPECRVVFGQESLTRHLMLNHYAQTKQRQHKTTGDFTDLNLSSSNRKTTIYDCADCLFSSDSFDGIGCHRLETGHRLQPVRLLQRERFEQELSCALDEICENRQTSTKQQQRRSDPDDHQIPHRDWAYSPAPSPSSRKLENSIRIDEQQKAAEQQTEESEEEFFDEFDKSIGQKQPDFQARSTRIITQESEEGNFGSNKIVPSSLRAISEQSTTSTNQQQSNHSAADFGDNDKNEMPNSILFAQATKPPTESPKRETPPSSDISKRSTAVLEDTVDMEDSLLENNDDWGDISDPKDNTSGATTTIPNFALNCTFCYRTFSSMSNRVVHERIHTNSKPCPCPWGLANMIPDVESDGQNVPSCTRAFRTNQAAIIHGRTHTGERPYTCLDCDKTFSAPANLIDHRRIHTGDMPYTCPSCDKGFAKRYSYQTHLLRHIGERNVPCDQPGCTRRFVRNHEMRSHSKHCSKRAKQRIKKEMMKK